ncbi:PPC domain-containing DNA-binding protein [Cellulomonas endometrii]|uniref:PPC domain-containing DNA-binding protein n=1 Tax=Cellulomonas endometrii TaxID=3036301 RepID=UPI0024AE5122|nr:DNA-binding protein [Cellulomonas endometrii]
MRSSEVTTGRRVAVVLEPGDDVLGCLADACRQHGIRQGFVPVFSGAFRSVRFIAADSPVTDQEPPLPHEVTVTYTEGIGSGTILWDEESQSALPHVHLAVGVKNAAAAGFAGHLLGAEAHYTVEVLLEEVLAPAMLRVPDPVAYGIPTLHFA